MLLWARSHSPQLALLPLSLLQEICEFFDPTALVDVYDNVFFLFLIEPSQTICHQLPMEVKERPPFFVWRSQASRGFHTNQIEWFSCSP